MTRRIAPCIAAAFGLCLVGIPGLAQANVLTDGGFETVVGTGLPDAVGVWGGDPALVRPAEGGISPAEGTAMLRFEATQLNGAGAGTGGDVWQLVDVTGLVGQTATLSARFNRVSGSSQSDTDFRLDVRAFAGMPDAFDDLEPAVPVALATDFSTLTSDANPATWQSQEATLVIPSGSVYLGVLVSAVENVQNDLVAPEFDGHYADDVVLEISPVSVPALGSGAGVACALVIGLVARLTIAARARRRR